MAPISKKQDINLVPLFHRSTHTFKAFKSYAQNLQLLRPHSVLSGVPQAEGLVYALNPVYLEIGQGGTSPMRGTGAIIFLFGLSASWYTGSTFLLRAISDWVNGNFRIMLPFLIISTVFMLTLMTLVCGYWLVTSFFNVTDPVVRLDRKRKKVWMWTGRGPIEMDWDQLVPAVQGNAISPYYASRIYRGLYIDLDEDQKPKITRKLPHMIQIGMQAAAPEGVRPAMEFVRTYMEEGPDSLKVGKLLSHRPKWWAMVNFFGVGDMWADYQREKHIPGTKAPWGFTLIAVLFFPIVFPLQITNWLALSVAPIPKWPKEIKDMHERDLANLEQRRSSLHAPRQTVVRVNGKLMDPSPPT